MNTSTKLCDLILVNYNSLENIKVLIKSINKYAKNIINKIYIINNSKEDLSVIIKLSKNKTIIIQNKENIGFGKAINIGIKKSKADYILLLNPDTELFDNSIINTFNYLDNNKNVGIIGGKIIDRSTKKILLSATNYPNFLTALFEFTNFKKIFKNNIFSNKFWVEKKYTGKKQVEVTSICGAYMFLRKKINNKYNLFDPIYFMYMEDIDIGINNIKNNYKVIFDPNSTVYHIGGASNNSKYGIVLKYWYCSRILFFKKNLNYFLGNILKYIFKAEEIILKIYHYITNKPNE